jgi:hypothetical protein
MFKPSFLKPKAMDASAPEFFCLAVLLRGNYRERYKNKMPTV